VRDLLRRPLSKRWMHHIGNVESYEFLAARNNGWLAVYYSYDYQGKWYAGGMPSFHSGRRATARTRNIEQNVLLVATNRFPRTRSQALNNRCL
jgi:hypothetical protein